MLYHGDTFEHQGQQFKALFETDCDVIAPWKEYDSHGVISEWTTTDKRPGEKILYSDGRQKLMYDIQATTKRARADGWNHEPYTGTKGEQAARAVAADFERLRQFCEGHWSYVVLTVELLDEDGEAITSETLGGIESDDPDMMDHARQLAEEVLIMLPDALTAKASALRAKLDKITGQIDAFAGA